jgi:hypothetical protein
VTSLRRFLLRKKAQKKVADSLAEFAKRKRVFGKNYVFIQNQELDLVIPSIQPTIRYEEDEEEEDDEEEKE